MHIISYLWQHSISIDEIKAELMLRGIDRKILEGIREMVAIKYIKNPVTRLNEIASLLGFSEKSAFSRDFKK